ncbi:MAG: hypothetical protein KBF64_05225 [Anaerolineaceae bacterium]|nr:hypothetical protein [Anaerolineaceae bacterium]
MNRLRKVINKRMIILVLIIVLLLATTACSLSDIGGALGKVGDVLDEMFKNIRDSVHFGFSFQ